MNHARSIGEIVNGIVKKIAETQGFMVAKTFTMSPIFATKKDGPQRCVNSETGLTCNANQERRS